MERASSIHETRSVHDGAGGNAHQKTCPVVAPSACRGTYMEENGSVDAESAKCEGEVGGSAVPSGRDRSVAVPMDELGEVQRVARGIGGFEYAVLNPLAGIGCECRWSSTSSRRVSARPPIPA